MSNVQVTDRQTLPVKWQALDVDGNPTTDLGGAALSYGVAPAAAGSLAADPADPSGLSTIFTPTDTPGNTGTGIQLQITASGGSLASPVSGVLLVDVVASTAASFSGTAGSPVSK